MGIPRMEVEKIFQGQQGVGSKQVEKEDEQQGLEGMATQDEGASKSLRGQTSHCPPTQNASSHCPNPEVEYFLGEPFHCETEDRDRLTVLTWNLDGLDFEDLKKRIGGLFSNIKKYRPDVILLQELIDPYLRILKKHFVNYEFLKGSELFYFTGIMLRKSRVQLLQSHIVNYPTTEMGRNLLMANVNFFGRELCVMTSHLESCRANSQERLNQLRRMWKRMKEAPDNVTVIFGGDTNLRDWEIKKLGGLPQGISDVWEDLGSPEDCRYTWDTTTNDNKEILNDVRLRFDRVFLRAARDGAKMVPESMSLVGLERLKCGFFTSDHWGILCTFAVPPQDTLNNIRGCSSFSVRKPVETDIDEGLSSKGPRSEVDKQFRGQPRVGIKKVEEEEMLSEIRNVKKIKVQMRPKDIPTQDEKPCKSLQGQPPPGPSPQQETTKGPVVQRQFCGGRSFQDELHHDFSPEGPIPHVESLQGQPLEKDMKDQDRLSVLTWNLDGVDTEDIRMHVHGLTSNIKKYHPDVILLQELIPSYLRTLKERLVNYDFLQGSEVAYFTGIMLRKSRVQLLQSNIVKYPTTEMGRNLLMANVNFFGRELCVMTSHLESCRANSQERLNQLRRMWKRMKEAPDNVTVIFGGDTNLRDWEVQKLGGLPQGISDVWEDLGSPEDCRYTWDTTTNDNREIPHRVQLRFDRFFLRAARDGAQMVPESMSLIGPERLRCGRFISDHWGILCSFAVQPQ
ncbi:uncharacterized protein tdp2a isoform X2 [Scleropages formosus]|uniref:Tyrosyl-DNA phosphodiesterase 2 n=2 Tax=Scleropages formosus TaxID=113540 RepID=A0A8C9V3A9_SCLFO|nr:uncharacterized protein LOC108940475 isoform X2 [Scleropages formosus]